MSKFFISDIVKETLTKTKETLTKTYSDILVGKQLYKANKTGETFLGKVESVSVNRFTEYDDVVLTIKVTDRKQFNVFGCNLFDTNLEFGWFYK